MMMPSPPLDQPARGRSTRRLFLRQAGGAGLALLAAQPRGIGQSLPAAQPTGTSPAPVVDPPATTRATTKSSGAVSKSIVADLINPMIISQYKIHEPALADMIRIGVCLATGQDSSATAWRSLLRPEDVVGIKFDEVGQEELGTTEVFAGQLIQSLETAGVERKRIVLIDVPNLLVKKLGTQPRRFGWRTAETPLGNDKERLAAVLDQVTAIVNVPFLKTHNLCGISGCLLNASIPFVRRQTLYLRDGGAPHIADIISLAEILPKLRLHIVNGLRGVFDKGPEARPEGMWPHTGVLVSKDPVAADQMSVDIINERRLQAKLRPIGDFLGRVAHIRAAAERGLGTDDQDYITRIRPS
ncbi:MAG TPA: DUF362 domain-containing protein [Phycisphaerae bacterium]|nr:DUF362 domain-containing protein [Phycisphaerae bacterium]HRY69225.1 DUF362 domain-containing protein [Phycisphaerae bacterium]HSA26186.1 DUF362 domain-containing protein [Phycisphaerae bacterium]